MNPFQEGQGCLSKLFYLLEHTLEIRGRLFQDQPSGNSTPAIGHQAPAKKLPRVRPCFLFPSPSDKALALITALGSPLLGRQPAQGQLPPKRIGAALTHHLEGGRACRVCGIVGNPSRGSSSLPTNRPANGESLHGKTVLVNPMPSWRPCRAISSPSSQCNPSTASKGW